MEQSASVLIDCDIDRVFQLTNDHVAEWSIVVVEDEVLEEKPGRIGSTFRTVTEEKGRRMEFEGVVTEWEAPRKSAVRLVGEYFDIETEYLFKDENGQTRVTQRAAINGKGVMKWFFLFFGWLMKASQHDASRRELDSLKAFCESNLAAN